MEYIKEVFAQYDRQCIRVYQAYNPVIAKEAVALQTFGESFNINRMTWIKPSFLWMMYRSNWGTKKNQECILALDVHMEKFNELLRKAVLTSPDSMIYKGSTQWEKAFEETTVYCQWDPDRNVNGNSINRAAIQIGLKGITLKEFLADGIYRIEDLTPLVKKWNIQRKQGKLNSKNLPVERIYPIKDNEIRKRLDM
ncbi:DUF4291 domain-containing protein [Paenibacillus lutimineralis]|uniref:DUF4291 domain-containing protein n=1 Tax=Paenibacillus lutimineralis TaxID=2707005 RepID=A0A3S9V5U9_9BACL|nr:DUF4291 domain-containing protein [Paenibacillus lutimineralis]AZS17937.1 DUF4291 domain-containing protein [Paenibacillus lutimineralis]